jgi:hypothetical protein
MINTLTPTIIIATKEIVTNSVITFINLSDDVYYYLSNHENDNNENL